MAKKAADMMPSTASVLFALDDRIKADLSKMERGGREERDEMKK